MTPTVPVSVVIPAHNREHMIERTLDSVSRQEGVRPVEILVVDDASTDATVEVARRHGARVIERATNGGAAAARNTGIRAATGDWVALLDSDDEWLPGALRTLWALRGEWSFVGGAAVSCETLDAPVRFHGTLSPRPVVIRDPGVLYPENFVAASGVMVDRKIAVEIGGYREDLRYAEDVDLWIRMLERRPAVVTPTVVMRWWRHGEQKSAHEGASRAAQSAIISGYEGRPWWSRGLVERNHAFRGWDALRRALSERRLRDAAREGALLARPRRAAPVAALLIRRARVRRVSRRLDADGRLVARPLR